MSLLSINSDNYYPNRKLKIKLKSGYIFCYLKNNFTIENICAKYYYNVNLQSINMYYRQGWIQGGCTPQIQPTNNYLSKKYIRIITFRCRSGPDYRSTGQGSSKLIHIEQDKFRLEVQKPPLIFAGKSYWFYKTLSVKPKPMV